MKPNPVTAKNIEIELDDHARLSDVGRKVRYIGLSHNTKSKTLSIACEILHYKKSSPQTDITGDVPNRVRTLVASDRNYINATTLEDYEPAIDQETFLPIIPQGVISEYDFWMYVLESQNALIFDKIYDAIELRASQGLFDN